MAVSKDELTKFSFLEWQDVYEKEKPFVVYFDVSEFAPDARRHNLSFHLGDCQVVHDVRNHEDDFSLDSTGFKYCKWPSQIPPSCFFDRTIVEKEYFRECEAILRAEIDNVDQICFFDWGVRPNIA